jgi:hypothetical protein
MEERVRDADFTELSVGDGICEAANPFSNAIGLVTDIFREQLASE